MADGPLTGKVAIVTGAGSPIGMGRAISAGLLSPTAPWESGFCMVKVEPFHPYVNLPFGPTSLPIATRQHRQ